MWPETYQLLTTGGLIVVLVKGVFDYVQKRMETNASLKLSRLGEAQASDQLMETWMTAVFAPVKRQAEEATSRADAAVLTADEATRRAVSAERGMQEANWHIAQIERLAGKHRTWDDNIVQTLRGMGMVVEDPPPLLFSPNDGDKHNNMAIPEQKGQSDV